MKYPYLVILLFVLLFVSCNKRYLFIRKVPVEHHVQQTSPRKSNETKAEVFIKPPLHDTISVDVLCELPPHLFTGKQSYSKPIQKVNKGLAKHKPIRLLHPNSSQKDDPDNPWNPNAKKAFWMALITILFVPLVLLFPPLYVIGFVFALLAMVYGSRAFKEFKTNPQKGKGLAIIAILIGTLGIALSVAFLITIIVYVVSSYAPHVAYGGYLLFTILAGVFWGLLLLGAFKQPSPQAIQKKEDNKRKQELLKEEKETRQRSRVVNPNAQVGFWILFLIPALILLYSILPGLGLLLLLGVFITSYILGRKAMNQIRGTQQKGMGKAKFAVYFTAAVALLSIMIAVPLTAVIIVPLLLYFYIKHRRALKAAKAVG